MVDLITQYSLSDIIIFIIILGLAIKGVVSFFDWADKRVKTAYQKINLPNQLQDSIEDHAEWIEKLEKTIQKCNHLIQILIQSDKDAIKAFITQQHHFFCYQKGWIDDYSLDCIERRYQHYQQQGGNTFVGDLMYDLRQLPLNPPQN